MKIYKSEDDKKTVESSTEFSGMRALEATLPETVPDDATFQSFGEKLLEQYKQENVAGIELHSVNFTIIWKPEKKDEGTISSEV